MNLRIKPIGVTEANKFVVAHHRHHDDVAGNKFSIALFADDKLVGVAICGRPTGIKYDTGLICELNRLCVIEGVKNGCSKLNGACARIAREMGYDKIITYTLMSEPGTSLIASGWELEAENVGSKRGWNSSKDRKRTTTTTDLFGTKNKYPMEMKKRWSKRLNCIGIKSEDFFNSKTLETSKRERINAA